MVKSRKTRKWHRGKRVNNKTCKTEELYQKINKQSTKPPQKIRQHLNDIYDAKNPNRKQINQQANAHDTCNCMPQNTEFQQANNQRH